jgi:hypothetical protein
MDLTNKLSSMKISKKLIKSKTNNVLRDELITKGSLNTFLNEKKCQEDSLTLSDFECDGNNLNLSDVVNEIIG